MPSKPTFHFLKFPRAAGWAVRSIPVLALLFGVAAIAGRGGPTPVSAQATGGFTVNVSVSPNQAAVGQPVSISYSATPSAGATTQPNLTNLTLSFGDGNVVTSASSSGQTTHPYNAAGIYNVMVTATDSAGGSSSNSAQVQVVQLTPPQVSLTAQTQTALVGQPVSFNYIVSSSAVLGNTAQVPTVTITFDDGVTQQLTAASGVISHVFNTAGIHTATLTAAYPGGQPNSIQATVSVGAVAPPVVTISASPTSVQPGQTVTFSYSITPSSTSVNIHSATISFGDSSSAQALTAAVGSVTHTYATQGTFPVTISATDSNGQTGQGSTSVTVAAPSVSGQPLSGVIFVNPPATGTSGQSVSFTVGTATTPNTGAQVSSYSINFGDNTAAVTATPGQAVTHTYAAPGSYTVTLTVTDSTGVRSTATSTIVIASPGTPVSYAAGWNIVAGPTGTIVTGNNGPLYTFQPGDTAYEVIPNGTPLKGGQGYWAYFSTATTSNIALSSPQTITVQAPAGQFFQIGNAGNTNATVSGADVVDAFNPATNSYVQTTTLTPGQGAWVYSAAGGTITITNAAQ